jgi:hypothetical protein
MDGVKEGRKKGERKEGRQKGRDRGDREKMSNACPHLFAIVFPRLELHRRHIWKVDLRSY